MRGRSWTRRRSWAWLGSMKARWRSWQGEIHVGIAAPAAQRSAASHAEATLVGRQLDFLLQEKPNTTNVWYLRLSFALAGQPRRLSLRGSHRFLHSLTRYFQHLREDSRFADDGDEICVGDPAREDMHVDVASDAGAGGFADVH